MAKKAAKSQLEQAFLGLWNEPRISVPGFSGHRPVPEREYRFHERRQWRFDFAWPEQRVAVEIHGGTYQRKRTGHTSMTGHQRDCEKMNAAQLAGWTVLAYTAKDLEQRPVPILEEIMQALNGANSDCD